MISLACTSFLIPSRAIVVRIYGLPFSLIENNFGKYTFYIVILDSKYFEKCELGLCRFKEC